MNPASEPLAEAAADDSSLEKRTQSDRRTAPTSPWGAFPPAGQRMRKRRADEHRQPYFVDRFSPAMWAIVLTLVLASIVDAVLTLRLIDAGGNEINPLMDRLLDHGILAFVLGKYTLTVAGLPLLLILKNHYLFGTRFRVGYFIPAAVAMYSVLIGYQLVLMQNCGGFW